MGFFSSRRQQKERRQQTARLQKLDGRELQYVVRRAIAADGSPAETVLGKGGRLIAVSDHVSVIAGGEEVFRNDDPATVSCGELLALNGVMIKGYNALYGQEDTLIAYYSYYRK